MLSDANSDFVEEDVIPPVPHLHVRRARGDAGLTAGWNLSPFKPLTEQMRSEKWIQTGENEVLFWFSQEKLLNTGIIRDSFSQYFHFFSPH